MQKDDPERREMADYLLSEEVAAEVMKTYGLTSLPSPQNLPRDQVKYKTFMEEIRKQVVPAKRDPDSMRWLAAYITARVMEQERQSCRNQHEGL